MLLAATVVSAGCSATLTGPVGEASCQAALDNAGQRLETLRHDASGASDPSTRRADLATFTSAADRVGRACAPDTPAPVSPSEQQSRSRARSPKAG
ncbi:hypothetical protein D3260_10775 [Salinisphaera sp. Q1T1-3]|nr:hypothetical protein D3260_10775 [Salinisphaera sp. Q1T1-3]